MVRAAPLLLAIYGVGDRLIAELSDNGFQARYREGGQTPGGWIVSKIQPRNVDLKKPLGKSGRFATLALPFGLKAEGADDAPASGTAYPAVPISSFVPGLSLPPIPVNVPGARP